MILIGQYDSPFVRRVGIALTLYGMTYERWPWSSFFDADKLRAYNPLTRVPTLLLDDGTVLRFLGEAHPGVAPLADYPALAAFSARLKTLPVFRMIAQKFIPPVGPAAAA